MAAVAVPVPTSVAMSPMIRAPSVSPVSGASDRLSLAWMAPVVRKRSILLKSALRNVSEGLFVRSKSIIGSVVCTLLPFNSERSFSRPLELKRSIRDAPNNEDRRVAEVASAAVVVVVVWAERSAIIPAVRNPLTRKTVRKRFMGQPAGNSEGFCFRSGGHAKNNSIMIARPSAVNSCLPNV